MAGIAYTREEVLGLTPSRLETLADLTAAAAMVARGEVAAVGSPLVERREAEALREALWAEAFLAENGIGDDNLRALYATNPEHELTVRHLIVLSARYETDETRAAARAKAERALERIRAGEPFPDVAAEVSEEPGAEGRQGLLQPGRRRAWVDEFWNAASGLEVGAVSEVVETQYGFHVLRLEGRDTVPFREVRDRVALDAARMAAGGGPPREAPPLPEGFAAAEGLDGLSDESAPAASFDGGGLTLGQILDHAAPAPPREWAPVRDGAPGARAAAAEDAARWAALRARAEVSGAAMSPGWRAAAESEWAAEVNGWAGVLGFRAGMGDEALKAGALAALSATGQAAQLARDAVTERRGLLERHYGRAVSGSPAP